MRQFACLQLLSQQDPEVKKLLPVILTVQTTPLIGLTTVEGRDYLLPFSDTELSCKVVQQAFSCVETTCRVDELPAFAMTISFLKHESPTVAKDLLLAIFQNPTWGEIRTTLSPVRGVSPVVGQNK